MNLASGRLRNHVGIRIQVQEHLTKYLLPSPYNTVSHYSKMLKIWFDNATFIYTI